MDFGGLVVRWAGLGYAVAHPDHPLSTPLAATAVGPALCRSVLCHHSFMHLCLFISLPCGSACLWSFQCIYIYI
jgi:hypothetical protein